MNTVFLVDGFNFYHSIKSLPKEYRWISYTSYCKHFLRKKDTLSEVVLFTAEAAWLPDQVTRHRALIEANKLYGVKVVLGKFKEKQNFCPICKCHVTHHEEKYTDVNIALYAYRSAAKDGIDQIYLVTGDTDLVPAINAIKEDFPQKRIGVIFPYRKANREMSLLADDHHKTKEDVLKSCVMDRVITRQGKTPIICPEKWIKP